MPLPSPAVHRSPIHTRQITASGWKRPDGLWDIEARLLDTKDHDYPLVTGLRPKGEPVHDMWVRVSIDAQFNIRDAVASIDAMPYPGACDAIAPDYRRIVGLNLMRGFRRTVAEMFDTVRGCSHVTELLGVLPSTAVQTLASDMNETEGLVPGQKPFQLDRCHALASTTETVRRYYPRWYGGHKTGS